MKNYRLFAILILVCVAAAGIITAPFGPQLYHPAGQPNQRTDHWQQSGDIEGRLSQPHGAEYAEQRADVKSKDGPKWTDIVQAVSAAFVAGITLLLVKIYQRQTNVLAEQARVMGVQASTMINQTSVLTESLRVSRMALKEAEKSTLAAMTSLRSGEKTAERQLRAYLLVAGATMKFPTPDDPVAHLIIKNFGQTPAHNVRIWIHMWIERHPLQVILPEPQSDFQTARSVLPPGNWTEMVMPKEPPVRREAIQFLGTPSGTIYVYGRIKYIDVFDIERITDYRLIYGGPEGCRDGRMHPDTEGNTAT